MDSSVDMKMLFEQSQKNSDRDLEITPEEAEKFRKAFDDPEFCKLMSEYVSELQDPANRAETETYISQLEGENKVPEGKELIRPQIGFVAKTYKVERDTKDKVFVNIVHSDKVAAPTKTTTAKGQNWSLPYSLGPPHMEKDHNGDSVVAFDCCFHPDATTMSMGHKPFRDLLVQTAISGIEEAYKRQKQQVQLEKNFRVLKGVKYKSGQVPSMLIDVSGKSKWSDPVRANSKDSSGDTPSASTNQGSAKEAAQTTENSASALSKSETPAIKKGFLTKANKESSTVRAPKTKSNKRIEEISDSVNGGGEQGNAVSTQPVSKVPNYTVTERGTANMGDFQGVGSSGTKVASTRPEELIYRIDIPLVTKSSKVELDVGQRELKFKYLDIYDMCIKLPYPVFDKRGNAKFDKTKKQLVLKLPVQPHSISHHDTSPPGQDDCTTNGTSDVETPPVTVASVDCTSGDIESQPVSTSHKKKAGSDKSIHSRWVSSVENDSASRQLREEVRAKAEEAKQANTMEAKPPPPKQESSATSTTTSNIDEDTGDYLPAVCFVGKKEGYVFKRGKNGLGYYRDCLVNSRTSDKGPTLETLTLPDSVSANDPCPGTRSNWKEFTYQFRQTKEVVAIIVQVQKIIESSVDIRFGNTTCDVYFKSVGESNEYRTEDDVEYAMGFDVLDKLDIKSCKYDVATQNMVIILQKLVPALWISSEDTEIVVQRSYNTVKSVSTDEENSMSTNTSNVDSMHQTASKLAEMQFSVDGLMDLD